MSEHRFPFTVEPWKVLNENKEYITPIFKLLKRRYRLESENLEADFYVLDAPEWTNVIALTPEREIILVEQYRYGTREPTLEIPGGMVDAGEEPLEAIKRELMEETGYVDGNWRPLGKVSANPAILNNYTHLYLAENCRFTGAENPDEHERIHVHTMPVEKFLDYVHDGTIHHTIVVAAAARLMLYLEQQRQE